MSNKTTIVRISAYDKSLWTLSQIGHTVPGKTTGLYYTIKYDPANFEFVLTTPFSKEEVAKDWGNMSWDQMESYDTDSELMKRINRATSQILARVVLAKDKINFTDRYLWSLDAAENNLRVEGLDSLLPS